MQVKKNLYYNIVSLLLNIIVGLIYSPYLIKNLGIIAYGVLPLALIVSHYISVITVSLTSSLARFYSVSLQRGDLKDANKYLNTAFTVVICLGILLSIPLTLIVLNVEKIFNIPVHLIGSSKILFALTFLSFPIALLETVLNISLYAYNRLDYLNVIKSFRIVFKFVFVFLLFFIKKDILYVGVSNFLTEFFVLLISIYYFKRVTPPSINVNLRLFDKVSLITMSIMAIWVIIQQLGETLLFRIDNIVVNRFWSTKESGILGAFTELGTYTMVVATVIGSLFGPLILRAYSDDKHEDVKKLTLDHSLSIGMLTAVIIGLLCGFSKTILNIWLGPEFVDYNEWLWIKLFFVPFSCASSMLAFALRTWNRVKFPAIMTIILGVINLLLVWQVGKLFSKSQISISYILLICLIFGLLQTYVLNGLVFIKIYKSTFQIVVLNSLKILCVLLSIFLTCFLIDDYLLKLSPLISVLIMGTLGLIFLILSFFIFMRKDQKNGLLKILFNN